MSRFWLSFRNVFWLVSSSWCVLYVNDRADTNWVRKIHTYDFFRQWALECEKDCSVTRPIFRSLCRQLRYKKRFLLKKILYPCLLQNRLGIIFSCSERFLPGLRESLYNGSIFQWQHQPFPKIFDSLVVELSMPSEYIDSWAMIPANICVEGRHYHGLDLGRDIWKFGWRG